MSSKNKIIEKLGHADCTDMYDSNLFNNKVCDVTECPSLPLYISLMNELQLDTAVPHLFQI